MQKTLPKKKKIDPLKTEYVDIFFLLAKAFVLLHLFMYLKADKKQGEQELVSEGGSNTRLRGAVTNLTDSVPLVTPQRTYF